MYNLLDKHGKPNHSSMGLYTICGAICCFVLLCIIVGGVLSLIIIFNQTSPFKRCVVMNQFSFNQSIVFKSYDSGATFYVEDINRTRVARVVSRGFTIPQKIDLVDSLDQLSAIGSNVFQSIGGNTIIYDCQSAIIGYIRREPTFMHSRFTLLDSSKKEVATVQQGRMIPPTFYVVPINVNSYTTTFNAYFERDPSTLYIEWKLTTFERNPKPYDQRMLYFIPIICSAQGIDKTNQRQ
ncbi:hypothetical protein AKO1_006384 [Acrasis kona]|uniref:Uncharacterized protein n=1 Tax=Acrasis kona TaxID=1008807 RepID=A0AAW2YIA8_9EUKA